MQSTINHTNSLKILGWQMHPPASSDPVLDVSTIDIGSFVDSSEEYATWETMLQRAYENKAVGSQRDAEYFLETQELIPTGWQKYNLIFSQTIWTSITGHKLCPYLTYRNNHWVLGYYWFLYDFHHKDRFLINKEKSDGCGC